MKLERSLVLNAALAVLAVGSVVAVLSTQDAPTTESLAARENNLFPSFRRELVQSIGVNTGSTVYSVERRSPGDAGQPIHRLRTKAAADLEVDAEAVEALVRSLELASFLRRFDSAGVDRAAFGLTAPKRSLDIATEGGSLGLRIGNEAKTPAGTTYAEIITNGTSTAIGLVRTEKLRELFPSTDDLRPRALLDRALSELQSMAWQAAPTAVTLRRGKGPVWLSANGERVRRDTVERLTLELSRAKSERFVEPGAVASAAAPADVVQLKLTPRAGSAVELAIGGSCPVDPALELLLRRAPRASAECVSAGLRGAFRAAAESLSDDAPFALRADEVETLVIERGGARLELTRHERGFRLMSPARADVELDAGNRRLEALTSATGTRVREPDLAALGLRPPAGQARLRSSVFEETPQFDEILELGMPLPAPDGRLPVRRALDGAVLLLQPEAARAYAIDSTLLRSTRLFDFPIAELASFAIELPEERQQLRRTASGGFELLEPKGHQHDGALTLDLVQALSTLEAERWVSERPDPSFGLDTPSAVLKMSLSSADAGARVLTLTLGRETAGGVFASLDTAPGVFVVARSFANQLSTLLLSRSVFASEPATLQRIALRTNDKHVLLERQGGEFTVAEGPLAPSSVPKLLESLASLRPEFALHTGRPRPREGFAPPWLTVELTPASKHDKPRTFRIGAADVVNGQRIYYGRVDNVPATYALPQSAVRELMDAL